MLITKCYFNWTSWNCFNGSWLVVWSISFGKNTLAAKIREIKSLVSAWTLYSTFLKSKCQNQFCDTKIHLKSRQVTWWIYCETVKMKSYCVLKLKLGLQRTSSTFMLIHIEYFPWTAQFVETDINGIQIEFSFAS